MDSAPIEFSEYVLKQKQALMLRKLECSYALMLRETFEYEKAYIDYVSEALVITKSYFKQAFKSDDIDSRLKITFDDSLIPYCNSFALYLPEACLRRLFGKSLIHYSSLLGGDIISNKLTDFAISFFVFVIAHESAHVVRDHNSEELTKRNFDEIRHQHAREFDADALAASNVYRNTQIILSDIEGFDLYSRKIALLVTIEAFVSLGLGTVSDSHHSTEQRIWDILIKLATNNKDSECQTYDVNCETQTTKSHIEILIRFLFEVYRFDKTPLNVKKIIKSIYINRSNFDHSVHIGWDEMRSSVGDISKTKI